MRSRKSGLVAVLGVVVLLGLAACGGGAGASSSTPTATTTTASTGSSSTETPTSGSTGAAAAATIKMAESSFSGTTSVTIKAGQAVVFDDPTSGGGVHNLVTGTNGAFQAIAGAPSQFANANGMAFNPGTTVTITFPSAGTFPITCTIHPKMQATVNVTP